MTCCLIFQFFSYILLLFAVLLYLPTLFWHFTAAPHLCSDLKFIMEELDKVYNRAIKAAKSARTSTRAMVPARLQVLMRT
jgi:pannexin